MKIRTVTVSHPDKELFPESGISKGELAGYLDRVSRFLLPHVRERPLSFKVFPSGIDNKGFYNKHAPGHFPEFVERIEVPTESGKAQMASADEARDLVFFASQNVIEIHGALSTQEKLHHPDQVIFDFDPDEGKEGFRMVMEAADSFKKLLDALGLPAFLKCTGSKGLHVHIPLQQEETFSSIKPLAKNLAERLLRLEPECVTLEQRKDKREGKVFADYLRNAYGQTAVVPYSPRARRGAPVAAPLSWDELGGNQLRPDKWRVKNIFRRLGQNKNPWKHFRQSAVSFDTLKKAAT